MAARRLGVISLVVIAIVILVYPPATRAFTIIMKDAPTFLHAVTGFILALRNQQAIGVAGANSNQLTATTLPLIVPADSDHTELSQSQAIS